MSTESQRDRGRVVLLVEDEPVLRASMVRGLSKLAGIDVVDAANVRDAKELIRALDADLLISDLDLPDGSGVELAAEMDRCGKRAPVVFVSAHLGKYRGQLPARPGVDVQEKPVSITRLRAIVSAQLGPDAARTAATSPFSVADYVQLAAMGRRSVELELVRGSTLFGTIVIKSGEVWSASDGLGDGLDAFRRLAFAREVTIACRALAEDAGERTIYGSAEAVLLEAARLIDEGLVRPEPAPVDSVPPRAPPSRSAPPRTMSGERRINLEDRSFDDHYERGVDALLTKNYAAAYSEFFAASSIHPDDPRVVANLQRLREMGYGGGS